MKRICIIITATLSLIGSSCNKSTKIRLSGKIQDPDSSSLLLVDDEYSDSYDTIAVKNGTFSIPVILDNPGFKYLILGKTRKKLFFAPGYSLNVTMSKTAVPDSSGIKIGGEGANENYILDSVLKAESKLNYSFIYSANPVIASKYIDSSYNNLLIYFDRLSSALDPAFIESEKIALRYGAAAFKISLGMNKEIKDPAYYSFLKDFEIGNDRYLNISDYRSFMDSYINSQTHLMFPADLPDDNEYLDSLLVTIEGIKNKKVREYYMLNKIKLFIDNDLIPDPKKYQTYFEKHNTNPVYAKQLQDIFTKKLLLMPGKQAPVFTIIDIANNPVSLESYKGNYVYIDFWATWCHPCIKELPSYLRLQSDYKGKNIVFLSISLDDEKKRWQDFSNEHELKNGNLWAEKGMKSKVAQDYQIVAIPQFVLIDKEGKFIESSTFEPSSPEIRILLDSLIQK